MTFRPVHAVGLLLLAPFGLLAQTADSTSTGVLALNNGRLLQGRITSVGDSYLVSLAAGGEVSVAVHQVQFVCASIDEAYRLKRDTMEQGRATSHLDLAEWCLNHELLARAADQLLAAELIDPDEPRLTSLAVRLEVTARNQQRPSESEPTSSAPEPLPGTENLDSITELPVGSVEQFTSSVQPVLMNHCSTNNCHGVGGDSRFRLIRPARGQVIAGRATRRNLEAVLQFVDRERPLSSPLLLMAQQAHGGSSGPIFDQRTRNLTEALRRWVRHVAGPVSVRPASVTRDASETDVLQLRDNAAWLRDKTAIPPPEGTRAIEETGFVPRDPFDPEIFNRMIERR